MWLSTGARGPSGLERWLALPTGRCRPGSNPTAENFGNSVYPILQVYFGGDTKRCRSLLSGVYARGRKISHQSECVTVVDSTTHYNPPSFGLFNTTHSTVHTTMFFAYDVLKRERAEDRLWARSLSYVKIYIYTITDWRQ